MTRERTKLTGRIILATVILLSGLAMLPFTTPSTEQISWRIFAGIYEPPAPVYMPLILNP